MNFEKDNIVKLATDEEYEIINKFTISNNTILLLNKKDNISLVLVKVVKEGDKTYFNELTEEEYKQALIELTKMKF